MIKKLRINEDIISSDLIEEIDRIIRENLFTYDYVSTAEDFVDDILSGRGRAAIDIRSENTDIAYMLHYNVEARNLFYVHNAGMDFTLGGKSGFTDIPNIKNMLSELELLNL